MYDVTIDLAGGYEAESLVGMLMDDDVAAELDADLMFGWDTELDIARWELAIERQRLDSLGADEVPF